MTLGPLVPADEYLHHQITDTFVTVGLSHRSWTEKTWAMAAARDGSLSIRFGLGKYANRGVADGVAGSIFLRIRAMLLAAASTNRGCAASRPASAGSPSSSNRDEHQERNEPNRGNHDDRLPHPGQRAVELGPLG